MPATIAVTNITPYNGNYQSFQSLLDTPPKEGPRTIPLSFTWSTDGIAPNFAIGIDLRSQRNIQLSQICSLYVDNLGNDADVTFYFSDTSFRLDVPADTAGVFPVITNSHQFVAYSPQATDGDQTFVQVLNFNPNPVAVEKTQFLSPETSGSIALPTSNVATHTSIFTGAGTLRALDIRVAAALASVADVMLVTLTDGVGGAILYSTGFSVPAATLTDVALVPLVTGLDIAIMNGIVVNLSDPSGHFTQGDIFINAYVSHK